jgi:hypothetical protein
MDPKALEQSLTLKDLTLLMESYKNNIEISTMLHEQQKQLLVQQDDLLEKQKRFCEMLDKWSTKSAEAFKDLHDNIAGFNKEFSTRMNSFDMEMQKNYNSLKMMMYIAWTGMGGICISLIGILITVLSK